MQRLQGYAEDLESGLFNEAVERSVAIKLGIEVKDICHVTVAELWDAVTTL